MSYLDISEEWHGAAAVAPPPPPFGRSQRREQRRCRQRPRRASTGVRGQVRGIARGVQIRSVERAEVLTFRVERYDASGNRLSAVPVEFTYYTRGQVGEGDEVNVTGTWSHGTLRAKKITNVSIHSQIQGMPKIAFVASIVGVVCVLGFILYIIVSVILEGQ